MNDACWNKSHETKTSFGNNCCSKPEKNTTTFHLLFRKCSGSIYRKKMHILFPSRLTKEFQNNAENFKYRNGNKSTANYIHAGWRLFIRWFYYSSNDSQIINYGAWSIFYVKIPLGINFPHIHKKNGIKFFKQKYYTEDRKFNISA
jgi:hypothetical protein